MNSMITKPRFGMAITVAAGAAFIIFASRSSAQDFPQWRGPNRDGVIPGFSVPEVWPDELSLVWSVEAGAGLSSPIIVGDRIFLFTRDAEEEVLTAFNLGDGSVVWRQKTRASFMPNPMAATFAFPVSRGSGPFATPAYQNGNIYTLGVTRVLSAYDAESGKPLWRNVLHETPEGGEIYYECPFCFMDCDGEQYTAGGICPVEECGDELYPIRTGMDTAQRHGLEANYYGAAASPLIIEEIGIVHIGDHELSWVVAFDLDSGAEKWRWEGAAAVGSSPVIAMIEGEPQVIAFTRKEVAGLSLEGETLWEFVHKFNSLVASPVVYGNRVIVSPYRGPITALDIERDGNTWNATKVWKSKLRTWVSSPVLQSGQLYGLAYNKRGQYFCLDAETGETIWRSDGRTATYASILLVGNAMLSLTDSGKLDVIGTGGATYDLLANYRIAEPIDAATKLAVNHFGPEMEVAETWAHPALSGNSIVIKGANFLACWRIER